MVSSISSGKSASTIARVVRTAIPRRAAALARDRRGVSCQGFR
jgi:hypothetical protein